MEINLEGLEFRLTCGDYQISNGYTVKCMLDDTEQSDWAKLSVSDELYQFLKDNTSNQYILEIGNDNGYEPILSGSGEFSLGHMLVIQAERRKQTEEISVFFLDATLQEAARYILVAFGVAEFLITDRDYGRRKNYWISASSYAEALNQINSVYGESISFYMLDGILYYGVQAEQEMCYVLSDEHVIDMEKVGDTWQLEIIPIPGLHVRQVVQVACEEYTGMAKIKKCVIEGEGYDIDMWIEFEEIEHG